MIIILIFSYFDDRGAFNKMFQDAARLQTKGENFYPNTRANDNLPILKSRQKTLVMTSCHTFYTLWRQIYSKMTFTCHIYSKMTSAHVKKATGMNQSELVSKWLFPLHIHTHDYDCIWYEVVNIQVQNHQITIIVDLSHL